MLKQTATKLFLLPFIVLIPVSIAMAASPVSDYNYQLTQYRKHNLEFSVLKANNQKTPTLDNQQKALQAAKQTIISRDTAKIAYIELILSQIRSQKVTQSYILQTEKNLVSAQEFYRNQIQLAKDIANTEDLANFTKRYLQDQQPHQSHLIKAQATKKLARLIRLQTDAKNAYNHILPKIDDKSLPQVSVGLAQITQLADRINQEILETIDSIKKSEVTRHSQPSFYSKQTERLAQIKALQVKLVNILVDLEKNYVN